MFTWFLLELLCVAFYFVFKGPTWFQLLCFIALGYILIGIMAALRKKLVQV